MPFGLSNDNRIEANNEVKLNGTFEFEIVDSWFHNVIETTEVSQRTGKEYTARRYTANPSNEQDVRLKLRLIKRPDIVVSDDIPARIGKKSRFGQLASNLCGVEAGSDLLAYLMPENVTPGDDLTAEDAKWISKKLRHDFYGKHVFCEMSYNEDTGYTRVKSYMPKPSDDEDDLASIPLQTNPGLQKQPLTAAQKAAEIADDDLNFDGLDDDLPF